MFSNVLVGLDGRQGGRDAIALAKQLTAPDAALTLAHVCGAGLTPGEGAALLLSRELEEARQMLERERDAASLDAQLVPSPQRSVGRGLHELAERLSADLLVIGSCRRALLGRIFLGNQTIEALNGAPCAVAIAPSRYAASAHRFAKLGVGYDGSPESERALDSARELAARSGSMIRALSVVSLQSIPYGEPIPDNWPDVAKELMDDELRRLRGLGDVDGDVSYGEPSEELWRFGQELDLMIVGSRSYGPIGRLVNGSTSNYLARRSPCPLLVLPRSAAELSRAGLSRATHHSYGLASK